MKKGEQIRRIRRVSRLEVTLKLLESAIDGEFKYGPLNGHQTVRNNLIPRCQELLAKDCQLTVSTHSENPPQYEEQ